MLSNEQSLYSSESIWNYIPVKVPNELVRIEENWGQG